MFLVNYELLICLLLMVCKSLISLRFYHRLVAHIVYLDDRLKNLPRLTEQCKIKLFLQKLRLLKQYLMKLCITSPCSDGTFAC